HTMHFRPATISSTSTPNDIPIEYMDLDQANRRNDEIKDWMKEYNVAIRTIGALLSLEETAITILEKAASIGIAMAAQEFDLLQVAAEEETKEKVLDQMEEVARTLGVIAQSNLPERLHSIQCTLAKRLDVYRKRGPQVIDDHITEIQNS